MPFQAVAQFTAAVRLTSGPLRPVFSPDLRWTRFVEDTGHIGLLRPYGPVAAIDVAARLLGGANTGISPPGSRAGNGERHEGVLVRVRNGSMWDVRRAPVGGCAVFELRWVALLLRLGGSKNRV